MFAQMPHYEKLRFRPGPKLAPASQVPRLAGNTATDPNVQHGVCLGPLPGARAADNNLLIASCSDTGPVDCTIDLSRTIVETQAPQAGKAEPISKRALDLVVATVALACLSPLLAVVALAIRLDSPGPIIFRQRRVGFDRREFNILKFRTMNTMEDGPDIRQASRGDPRVTRIGKWLRCTSVDELPQLLNVIRGDMSIVGPRPHAVAHDQEFSRTIAGYVLRYRMKPGITGWAQVNGCRGATPTLASMQARIDYDTWYMSHWSFGFDVRIIIRTFFEIIHPSNAY